MKQNKIFLDFEADCWFERNIKSEAIEIERIINVIQTTGLLPKKVLEIGCSNAIRLNIIKETFQSTCYGIDPSKKAIIDGKKRFPDITLSTGTAESLPYEDDFFDTIIFGFCLYLCDRSDLFKIAYEADRCLRNEGTIIIKDFYPPFPYKNKYSHHEEMYSYKMDYSKMFLWNPEYSITANSVYTHSSEKIGSGFNDKDKPNEKISITILRKNILYSYPEEPF